MAKIHGQYFFSIFLKFCFKLIFKNQQQCLSFRRNLNYQYKNRYRFLRNDKKTGTENVLFFENNRRSLRSRQKTKNFQKQSVSKNSKTFVNFVKISENFVLQKLYYISRNKFRKFAKRKKYTTSNKCKTIPNSTSKYNR